MLTNSRWLPAAALLLAVACSAPPSGSSSLLLTARPTAITDQGEDTDLRVQALDGAGRPGKGTVVLTAAHGDFPVTDAGVAPDGGVTTTLTLDSAGIGWTTYACDSRKDGACNGKLVIAARWGTTDPVTASATVTVTGCGGIVDAGPPPIVRRCAPPTSNECAGGADAFLTDAGVPVGRLNGPGGNGFDDDCDGLVDEGCACSSGSTADCAMLPATQVDPGSGLPVGWCATNARGSMSCQFINGVGTWAVDQPGATANCAGAQAPLLADTCNSGDFNCDGLDKNNTQSGCRCASGVRCPTSPLVVAPNPALTARLPNIDGGSWILDSTQRAAATNWRWTVVGGACDSILPNPTFALFQTASTASVRIGGRATVTYDATRARYVASGTSKLAALVAQGTDSIFPVFSSPGDYLVQGEFDVGTLHGVCTQRVQVVSPGLHAQLCWDTEGPVDLDLHLARLQDTDGGALGDGACVNGWDDVGCLDQDFSTATSAQPDWGFGPAPALADGGLSCTGWGSRLVAACPNPRRTRAIVSCLPATTDPRDPSFCGPERLDLDAPRDGDRYVVGVNYAGGVPDGGPTPLELPDGGVLQAYPSHPHVDLTCNGKRLLSAGFDPVNGQTTFPALLEAGRLTGDFWTVATITTFASGGLLTSCVVDAIPSRESDPLRDGTTTAASGTGYCVDSASSYSPAGHDAQGRAFVELTDGGQGVDAGAVPLLPGQWCKH